MTRVVKIMLTPGTAKQPAVAGFVLEASVGEPPEAFWMISAQPEVDRRNAARLIAVLLVHLALDILPRIFLPDRPRMATLQHDGQLLDSTGAPVRGHAAAEVERVTKEILRHHGAYAENIVRIMQRQPATAPFVPIPAASPLYVQGAYIAEELPAVPIIG